MASTASQAVVTRPVGHYTDLVKSLGIWIDSRKSLDLDTELLERAVAYLEEAREMSYYIQHLQRLELGVIHGE